MEPIVGDSTDVNASGDFGIITNSGTLGMWSGLNSGNDNSLLTSTTINNNAWHHVVSVNDGSFIHLYLDGHDTGQTLASGLPLDSYGWYLGAQHYYGGAAYYHHGSIDEFVSPTRFVPQTGSPQPSRKRQRPTARDFIWILRLALKTFLGITQ